MRRAKYLGTLLRELVVFARAWKAWWMVPLVLTLLALGFLVLTSQLSSHFVYVLF